MTCLVCMSAINRGDGDMLGMYSEVGRYPACVVMGWLVIT